MTKILTEQGIDYKPLSVNEVWKGRRFKTDKYQEYELIIASKLRRVDLAGKKLKLEMTFGFSSVASDIDNCVKPLLDIFQKKFNFDDKEIYELSLKKTLVKKNQEYFYYKFTEL